MNAEELQELQNAIKEEKAASKVDESIETAPRRKWRDWALGKKA